MEDKRNESVVTTEPTDTVEPTGPANMSAKKPRPKEPLKRRILWWAVYAVIAGMMGTGIYLILLQNTMLFVPKATLPGLATPAPMVEQTPIPTPAESQTQAPEQSPEQSEEPAPKPIAPMNMYFTKPGYKCPIYAVGRTENNLGIATIDSATDAAWFNESAAPGNPGNCIINGHNSWNKKMGTFSYLKKIEYGEEVVVEREDGSLVYYEVYSIDQFPYDNFPGFVLSQEGFDRLTLVTCLGDYERAVGQSLTRVVVTCKPTGIVEAPDPTPVAGE